MTISEPPPATNRAPLPGASRSPDEEGTSRWAITVHDNGTDWSQDPDGGTRSDGNPSDCVLTIRGQRPLGVPSVACLTTIEVLLPGPEGPKISPFPPFDLAAEFPGVPLPRVSGATLGASYRVTGTPFGPLEWLQVFVDGQPRSFTPGGWDDGDVNLEMDFTDYLHLRTGALEFMDVLRPGCLTGDLGQLMMLAGLVGSIEFDDLWARTSDTPGALLANLTAVSDAISSLRLIA